MRPARRLPAALPGAADRPPPADLRDRPLREAEAGEPTDLEALATWAEKAANLLDDQIERAKKERSRLRSLAKRTRTKIDADAQPALLAEGKAPADPPWVALLGKLPDAVIAEQHAIPVGRVARRRRKSGIHAPIVSTEPAAEAAEPAAEAAAETAARIELRADVLLTDPMDQHRAQRIALAVFDQAGVKTDERSALFRRLEIDPNDGDRVWSALCAAGDVHRDRSSGWATCTRDVLPAGDEPSRAPEPEPEPAAKAPTWSAGEVWIRGGLAREITRVASDCVWWRPTGRRGDGKPYAERRTTPGAWARWARGARRAETDAERRVYGVGGAL